jgi:biopolymer transport protein ExbD
MRTSQIVVLLTCLVVAVPAFSFQRGSDPLTGTWTGDWGPSPGDRNTVSVDLKSNGKTVTGVVHSINFQRPDVMLEKSTFDPNTGAVHLEADASTPNGKVHYVIDGKVANGMMTGSWNHDGKKGDFKLIKK